MGGELSLYAPAPGVATHQPSLDKIMKSVAPSAGPALRNSTNFVIGCGMG